MNAAPCTTQSGSWDRSDGDAQLVESDLLSLGRAVLGPNRVAGHPEARVGPTQRLLDDATPEIFIATMTNEGYICLQGALACGLGAVRGVWQSWAGQRAASEPPRVNWSES